MDSELAVTTVQERLKSLIQQAEGEGRKHSFGFVIHPRADQAPLRFGVITLGGESLTLTRGLMMGLLNVECWVCGSVPARLRIGSDEKTAKFTGHVERAPEAAARRVVITRLARRGYGRPQKSLWPLEGMITPENLTEPLLILTRNRPRGWPS